MCVLARPGILNHERAIDIGMGPGPIVIGLVAGKVRHAVGDRRQRSDRGGRRTVDPQVAVRRGVAEGSGGLPG